MVKAETLYIRMRNRVIVKPNQPIVLEQIAQFMISEKWREKLSQLPIIHHDGRHGHLTVIDLIQVIRVIKSHFPELQIEAIGDTQTIIEQKVRRSKPKFFAIIFVWLLLFVGSGLAVINFHEDVSMEEVHIKLYTLLTGEKTNQPLYIQIPYSIGIGIGMILFFNHLFRKKFNEEPSPLEVEMYLYQQNMDQYILSTENEELKGNEDHDHGSSP